MKKMMILGASALQVPAIKKAKELGYQLILVDYDPDAVGFLLGDINLVVSTLDQEEVLKQALIYEPDVVLTSTSDGPVRTAAYVNEKLGKKPDLSYEDSLCATIKSHMRDRLRQHQVPIPEYYIVHDKQEYENAVAKLQGVCIVKPADNAGSRGVVLLENETEDKVRQVYEFSRKYSRNGIVLVEEYMSGPEVSVESMTVEGKTTILTITDKQITPPPYFVEIGHSEPSQLSVEIQERMKEITRQAVAAIGLMNGPSHTELKLTQTGPKIVEIATRLGGDFITSKLVPLSTGIDLVGNSILLATGEPVDLSPKWQKGSAIRFLQGKQGTIESLKIDQEVYLLPGVEEVLLYKKEGDQINNTQSSNDRLGHIIATGTTAEAAMKTAEAAIDYISLEII